MARHHLAGDADLVSDAVGRAIVLHSSDPVTPYLSLRARVAGVTIGDVDRALLDDRSLWRLHAMRRTLFVARTEDGPLLEAAAGRKVASREWRRVASWLGQLVAEPEVPSWLESARQEVLAELTESGELTTAELQERVPRIAGKVTVGSGKYLQDVAVASRLLYLMGMRLDIVRTRTSGTWRSSQYAWAVTDRWFDPAPEVRADDRATLASARAELASRYLAAFGPATTTDLKWWTGWTVVQTRRAIAGAGAVEVELDGGGAGYVLPGDTDPAKARADAPVVALLPALDHTLMGWKERAWYLGGSEEEGRVAQVYDRNGNIGPTIVADGEVVGAWAVRSDGEVVTSLLADVGREASDAVEREAAGLTAWLDGTPVTPRFPTPLENALRMA